MLDTNALSAWADADSALFRVLPKDRLWQLPVVALGEFLFGIRQSRERAKLERWIVEECKSEERREGGNGHRAETSEVEPAPHSYDAGQ